MGAAEATKVSDEQRTSSPGPTPARRRARWRAAVPEETATACFEPTSCAKSCSKASRLGPAGAIQLDWKASRTSSISVEPMSGGER